MQRRPKKKPSTTIKGLSRPQDEDFTCVICLDIIKTQGRIPVCEHKYCYTCILEWSKVRTHNYEENYYYIIWLIIYNIFILMQKTNKCPLCKKTFRCITKVVVSLW